MNDSSLLLFAGLGFGLAYYVYNDPNTTVVTASLDSIGEIPTNSTTTDTTLVCPSGTVLMYDQTCCDSANVLSDGSCGDCPNGYLSAVDSTGNATCCPTSNIDSNGVCQTCPIGTTEQNGSCVSTESSSSSGNPLDISTGSTMGDIASNVGIGLVAGIAMDQALDKSVEVVSNRLATKVSTDVATDVAEKAAKEAAEKAAQEAGEMIAKRAGIKASQKFASKIATKIGTRLSIALAKTAALSSTVVGIPSAIIDLCLTAISIALVQTLSLDEDSFEPNKPNQFSLSQLPDWAQTLMGSIPLFGSIIDILAAPIVTTSGCSDPKVEQNGLCYDPPRAGWQCESFLCYKDYPDFENNGMLHTRQNITKKILIDTGTIPDSCSDGKVKSGGFCYDDQGPEWNIVAGTAWGICPSGSDDQGALCSNLTTDIGRIPDKSSCDRGQRDDGTSCWEDVVTSGGACRGGECNTWCDGDRDALGNCFAWNLKTSCTPVTCDPVVSTGCGCIKKTLSDRQSCNDSEDLVGGLCYPKCVNGTSRTGLSCGGVTTKPSKVLTPYPLECGDGKVDGAPWGSAGLCYTLDIPQGYQRQSAGLLSQTCPQNTLDSGVTCLRETYTREPTVALTTGIRDRRHQQQDRAPKTCDQTKLEDPDDLAACNAMLCLPDEDIASGPMADFCVSRCRESYQPGPNGTCIRAGGGTDINGNPFVEDSYQRRNPFLIDWGSADDTVPASTSESTWAYFTSMNTSDVGADTLAQGDSTISLNITQRTFYTSISGPNWNNVPITYQSVLPDGRIVYAAYYVAIGYNTNIVMIASDREQRYIPTNSITSVDISSYFDPTLWSTYNVQTGYYLQ